MKKLRFIAVAAISVGLLSACNNDNNKGETTKSSDQAFNQLPDSVLTNELNVREVLEGDTMQFKNTATPAFQARFKQVVNAYLAMKDGFANDNLAVADQQASQLLSLLNSMPDNELSGSAQTYWKEKKAFLTEHLQMYQNAKEAKEKQENFAFLSSAMIKSVNAFGYGNEKLFVVYCPMANDSRGAYWLSQTREIQNPYMGQKMPKCGAVKGTL